MYVEMSEMVTNDSDESRLLVNKVHVQRTWYLYILTASSAIGGFLFGYDTGVISGVLILIQDPRVFDLNDIQSEIVVSSAIAGAAVGAFLGGIMSQHIGRKGVILVSSIMFTVGALLMAMAGSYAYLVIGRVVVGIGIGLSSMVVPMYIAESAPSNLRGTLVGINTVFITAGQFTACVVDAVYSSTTDGWRWMLGLATIPAMIQFCAFLVLPESPRWLISNAKFNQARVSLQKIRGDDNIDSELSAIQADCQDYASFSSCALLWSSGVPKALVLGCALQVVQQFSGINTIMYYGATILQMAGFTDDTQAIWLSTIVSFSNFLFTFVGICLVDRMGRRKLTLYSLVGISLALFILMGGFYIAEETSIKVLGVGSCSDFNTCLDCVSSAKCGLCSDVSSQRCIAGNDLSSFDQQCNTTSWHFYDCPGASKIEGWFIFAGLFFYLACFASGMGSMPWIINSEIFPQDVRSLAMGISTTVNWISNLIVASTFLTLTRYLSTYGAFGIYAIVALSGLLFFYGHLPETKGLSLEQIHDYFHRAAKARAHSSASTSKKYVVLSTTTRDSNTESM